MANNAATPEEFDDVALPQSLLLMDNLRHVRSVSRLLLTTAI